MADTDRRAAAGVLVTPALQAAVATLPAAMTRVVGYHFGWLDAAGQPAGVYRGKALRPAFTLAAARAVGADPGSALPAAVAVELVHNFSLLHDDVMDRDTTRRHRPTAWTVFGTDNAILAGNALLTLALDLVASEVAATRLLAAAVQELLGGQAADLCLERRTSASVAEAREMALAKTGALFGAACALGALAAGKRAADVDRLTAFGRQLGLAFQFVDDLLGIWGDPATTGKPVHSDLRSRKKSLPVVAALNAATPESDRLAALYGRERALDEDELREAADLVVAAGGRAYAQKQAEALVDDALASISDLAPEASADLAALAGLAVRRER
ncbi:geranylgeranyl diphosphate synthase, type I [Micromonospora pallida]|uniref:Geranylgeranyl diphosphate synthase, type I n=1 Tax=Micromonospora pallida TaxID=145854 RepID=A0A1C6RXB0_9ACTN|nr:polyprenyl synthetase family protein [Micromonospora pallida]SCL21826.1 geranylgeranyl diphosphate synthase, type I [Micromonospora pallida]